MNIVVASLLCRDHRPRRVPPRRANRKTPHPLQHRNVATSPHRRITASRTQTGPRALSSLCMHRPSVARSLHLLTFPHTLPGRASAFHRASGKPNRRAIRHTLPLSCPSSIRFPAYPFFILKRNEIPGLMGMCRVLRVLRRPIQQRRCLGRQARCAAA
jgi:hypothetical protein